MHRLFALLGAVLFAGTGLTAQQPAAAHGPVTVNGVYILHLRVNLASALPDGATITCKARIVPQTTSLGDGSLAGQVETVTGVATVNGTLANCAVEIPFAWTVENAHRGVQLNYQIVEAAVAGSEPVEIRTSAQRQLTLPNPPLDGVATLRVNATI